MITIQKWEEMVRRDNMKPVGRRMFYGMDIYVASGALREADRFYEDGHYYKTMYAIGQDGTLDIAAPLAFDMAHDPELEISQREYARIEATYAAARDHIENGRKAGRYGNG